MKQIPPTGPSDEALERFGRLIADGLRNRFPDYDFIVRRRDIPPEAPTPSADEEQTT